ncbi:saccharopine dehydrogenase NADP-binding domain-containing protein [Streptomyces sp. NPDC127039]|uniref:saccharopine dehydrogenase NADP-binding domain-containing protein n=1 Tax=Streptomyces sp. NPDC127039 TaxID=3347115 RepID=UPI003646C452
MIGVIGGYGDVGRHAVLSLRRAGQRVRVGGRSATAAAEFLARRLPDDRGVEHRAVDARDTDDVTAFAEGLSVLVNCAGPSHLTGSAAADAAFRAGVDYVDAAGDDALHALLDDGRYRRAGLRAVLSAGLRPGLTGLFPRAVAGWARSAGTTRLHSVTVRTRVLDLFTTASALEYLHGAAAPGAGPRAAWRDGAPRPRALTRRTVTDLPFFPGTSTELPQLSAEDARTARALGVRDGDWLTLVEGEHVLAAFDRVHALPLDEAAARLCGAARLDLAGRSPSVTVAVVVAGEGANGAAVTRTAVLKGTGNAPLSGAVAAHSALSVLRGDVPPGRHFAAEILDAERTLAALTGTSVRDARDARDAQAGQAALAGGRAPAGQPGQPGQPGRASRVAPARWPGPDAPAAVAEPTGQASQVAPEALPGPPGLPGLAGPEAPPGRPAMAGGPGQGAADGPAPCARVELLPDGADPFSPGTDAEEGAL